MMETCILYKADYQCNYTYTMHQADYQSPQMPAQMGVMEESTSNIIIKVNLGAKTPRRK